MSEGPGIVALALPFIDLKGGSVVDLPPDLPAPIERVALRRARGLTLRSAAAFLGVYPSTLMRWERGGTPRSRARVDYARFLQGLREGAL